MKVYNEKKEKLIINKTFLPEAISRKKRDLGWTFSPVFFERLSKENSDRRKAARSHEEWLGTFYSEKTKFNFVT